MKDRDETISATPDAARTEVAHWYNRAAKFALAAGAAVAASPSDANATIVHHIVNKPVAPGANHESSPNGQQQMLYFDLVTGNTFDGVVGASSVGLSTMDANPQANYRFGLIRVGKAWAGLYGRAANNAVPAVNNQAMGTGAPVTWWPVAPSGTWQQANYVRPFQLAAGAVIGPDGEFHSAPPRTWMGETFATGINVQTMVAGWAGFWTPGTTGYFGLRFTPGDAPAGAAARTLSALAEPDYHYAWVHLSVDENLNMTLHSMAYETELNTPIVAGQISSAAAAPEPSSISLLLLGAAGLAPFRRQRNRARACA